jgi:hypothetical protein
MALLSRAEAQAKAPSFVSGTGCARTALPVRSEPLSVETNMLWTIAVILIVLWLLGVVVHIGGGLIHLLLVIAVIVGLIQLFTGRRV